MMPSSVADTELTLRDGRRVQLRAIRRSDEDEILQAFERLDPEARYMRFMRVVREANVAKLRKLLASFPESGIGLVATVPAADGIDIVGSTLLLVGNEPASGEFSVTVAAEYARTGLGHALMNALIGAAKARGLAEMHGFVLRVNTAMLRLAEGLGFNIFADPDDPSVVICRLRLDSPSATSSSH